jgi:hypothetical protein
MKKLEFDKCLSLVENWLINHPEYEPYRNDMNMTDLFRNTAKGLGVDISEGCACYNKMIKPYDKDGKNSPFCFAWDERFDHSTDPVAKDYFITFHDSSNDDDNITVITGADFGLIEFCLSRIK